MNIYIYIISCFFLFLSLISISYCPGNPRGKKAAWEFVRGNWKDICAHLSGAASLIGHCASACISSMTHEQT